MINPSTSYYANANVRARIVEFLGGDASRYGTCRYVTKGDTQALQLGQRHRTRDLEAFLGDGNEIVRSMWDKCSLLADFDVEYVNFDNPAEVYLNPERTFALQRPVAAAIESVLQQFGISPLHLVSGRGHHFVWRIKQDSPAFARLVQLGEIGSRPVRAYAETQWRESNAWPQLAAAFSGLGLVMEFLAHRVKEIAAPKSSIPVELTAIEVGPSGHGREMISLDISEYGDPLASRMLRVPFSVYLKPWQQRGSIADAVLATLKPLFVIPLTEGLEIPEALEVMRDAARTTGLAGRVSAVIPDASDTTGNLIAEYETSELKRFHDDFYAQEPEPPERWPETYDRTPLDLWPRCARLIHDQPNDLLLRPSCILRVVRVLLALGWHPRHIAGLIRSKYERDFNWTQFTNCDPATRADFYVRVFAGLFATRRDDMVDFNCTSAQEEGLCFFNNCNDNLLRFRESALNRREHDQLARGPVNRLLLRPEHS